MSGVWMHGASGRMGQEIRAALAAGSRALTLAGQSFEPAMTKEALAQALARKEVALAIDFTTPEGNTLLREALAAVKDKAVLVGTTGLPPDAKEQWKALAAKNGLRVLIAPNTSLGVLVTSKLVADAAKVLARLGFDVEITETHHKHKVDAPSGTAKFLAEAARAGAPELTVGGAHGGPRVPREIGMHAVRGGGVFGEHEVRFLGEAEEVTVAHRAFSRSLFATGALVLGEWLLARSPGFYALADVAIDELAAKAPQRR
jgi:4-hydroxy-tetrahydrodipicolinate reductase